MLARKFQEVNPAFQRFVLCFIANRRRRLGLSPVPAVGASDSRSSAPAAIPSAARLGGVWEKRKGAKAQRRKDVNVGRYWNGSAGASPLCLGCDPDARRSAAFADFAAQQEASPGKTASIPR
jgi:hypothetical protein